MSDREKFRVHKIDDTHVGVSSYCRDCDTFTYWNIRDYLGYRSCKKCNRKVTFSQ